MTSRTEPRPASEVTTNRARVATVRVGGTVGAPALNDVAGPDGRLLSRPGQGGVVLGVTLGHQATRWESDHLEPGVTLTHSDPAANRALQTLACIGNLAIVRTGAAAGLRGQVSGKHGGVLVAFPAEGLHLVAPGDHVTVDATGVGLRIDDAPDVHLHSCAPDLLAWLVPGRGPGGRLRVLAAAQLPSVAAAAGIGMPSSMLNIDLDIRHLGDQAGELAFGDVVVLRDHDHRFGRQHRPGWVAVGVVAHGHSVGGGHGIGMTTVLTAPAERLAVEVTGDATLARWTSLVGS